MHSFTMCLNESCRLAQECYRFKAKPKKPTQAYGYYNPRELDMSGKIKCNNFMEIPKAK